MVVEMYQMRMYSVNTGVACCSLSNPYHQLTRITYDPQRRHQGRREKRKREDEKDEKDKKDTGSSEYVHSNSNDKKEVPMDWNWTDSVCMNSLLE